MYLWVLYEHNKSKIQRALFEKIKLKKWEFEGFSYDLSPKMTFFVNQIQLKWSKLSSKYC